MKLFAVFFACSMIAFVGAGYQMGFFNAKTPSADDEQQEGTAEKEAPKKPKKARFPEDLTPAARYKPIPQAAIYSPKHLAKIAFLAPGGSLHSWHESLEGVNDHWLASNVEETSLVVIVRPEKKTQLSVQRYVNGPPVYRFQYDREISVVEAKTGRILCLQSFASIPRQAANHESYATTALGRPVSQRKVFEWVISQSRQAFPNTNGERVVFNATD